MKGETTMKTKLMRNVALAAMLICGTSAASAEGLTIAFTIHSSPSNTFWQAVKKGFEDGCTRVQASCNMIFTQTEGSIEQQVANMQAAIASKPYALITSIVDNKAFDQVIADARKAGIVVIAANVDDTEGAAGNARQAFVGQGFIAAGHSLAMAQSANFPKTGPIKVLVGISAPGQNWSEQRGGGVIKFLEEYKKAGHDISWERIDSGTDLAIVADRVGAKLAADPGITAYFDTGFWHAAVARVLRDRGVPAGKVLLGGFDLVPEVLNEMKSGYVQVQVDQQPYMQGFMPVMEAYLSQAIGLSPADIDTGQGIVTPAMVDKIMGLATKGVR